MCNYAILILKKRKEGKTPQLQALKKCDLYKKSISFTAQDALRIMSSGILILNNSWLFSVFRLWIRYSIFE